MTVKLYSLTSCASTRKVRKFLVTNNISHEEFKMESEPLSWEQLFDILMYTENGVEDILSTRSKGYAELVEEGIDFEELSLTELHYIIKRYPRILKTPIVVAKETTLVGYKEEDIEMLLGNRKVKVESYLKMLDAIRQEEDKNFGTVNRLRKYDKIVG